MSLSPSTLPSASYVCTFAVVPALGRFGHLRLIVYAFDRFGFHLHDCPPVFLWLASELYLMSSFPI